MLAEVAADLLFGGGNKAEADFIADFASDGTNAEGEGIKRRIQATGVAAEIFNAFFAPDQVVDFFFGRVLHCFAYFRQFRCQGLTLIQRLCTDFTGMVNSHQPGSMLSFLL